MTSTNDSTSESTTRAQVHKWACTHTPPPLGGVCVHLCTSEPGASMTETANPADYADRARLNRPRTHDKMRIAVHELAARGFTDYEIAFACELAVEQVRRMLGSR